MSKGLIEYTRHIVGEMNEEHKQYCVVCGLIISDYSDVMWPADQGPPEGFAPGVLYKSKGNPSITTTIEPDKYKNCNDA